MLLELADFSHTGSLTPAATFEKAPYAQTTEDWNKLLPWNIEITPFKMRGEWVE